MSAAIRITLLIALVSLGSCGNKNPKELSGRDFITYAESEKSNLHTIVRSGIWSYDIQFKPAAYVALREADPSHLNKTALAERMHSLEKTVWFNVTIRVHDRSLDPLKYGATGLEEYNNRLDYFLNKAGQNFHLKYGNSEMKQIGYVFENNFNIKPEVVAIVGFSIPDSSPRDAISLEYYDELFNAGIIKFGIRSEDLQRIPALSI